MHMSLYIYICTYIYIYLHMYVFAFDMIKPHLRPSPVSTCKALIMEWFFCTRLPSRYNEALQSQVLT